MTKDAMTAEGRETSGKISGLINSLIRQAIPDAVTSDFEHGRGEGVKRRVGELDAMAKRLAGAGNLSELGALITKEVSALDSEEFRKITVPEEERVFRGSLVSSLYQMWLRLSPGKRADIEPGPVGPDGRPELGKWEGRNSDDTFRAKRDLAVKYGLSSVSIESGASGLQALADTDKALAEACKRLGIEPASFGLNGRASALGGWNLIIGPEALKADGSQAYAQQRRHGASVVINPYASSHYHETIMHEWQHMVDGELAAKAKQVWLQRPELAPGRTEATFPHLFSSLSSAEQQAIMPRAAAGIGGMLAALNGTGPDDVKPGGSVERLAAETREAFAKRLSTAIESDIIEKGGKVSPEAAAEIKRASLGIAGDGIFLTAAFDGPDGKSGAASRAGANPIASQSRVPAAWAALAAALGIDNPQSNEAKGLAWSRTLDISWSKGLERGMVDEALVMSRMPDSVRAPRSDFMRRAALSDRHEYLTKPTELNSRGAGRATGVLRQADLMFRSDDHGRIWNPTMNFGELNRFNGGLAIAAEEAGVRMRPPAAATVVAEGALAEIAKSSKAIIGKVGEPIAFKANPMALAGIHGVFAGLSALSANHALSKRSHDTSSAEEAYLFTDYSVNAALAVSETGQALGAASKKALENSAKPTMLGSSMLKKTVETVATNSPSFAAISARAAPAAALLSFAGAGKSAIDAWRANKAGDTGAAKDHTKASAMRFAGAAGAIGASIVSGAVVGSALPVAGTLVGAAAGLVIGMSAEYFAGKAEYSAMTQKKVFDDSLREAHAMFGGGRFSADYAKGARDRWAGEWDGAIRRGLTETEARTSADAGVVEFKKTQSDHHRMEMARLNGSFRAAFESPEKLEDHDLADKLASKRGAAASAPDAPKSGR